MKLLNEKFFVGARRLFTLLLLDIFYQFFFPLVNFVIFKIYSDLKNNTDFGLFYFVFTEQKFSSFFEWLIIIGFAFDISIF